MTTSGCPPDACNGERANDACAVGPGTHRDLCILVHGMGGTARDWDAWLEVLSSSLPTWTVKPLQSLANGSRFLGEGLDQLAKLAAAEALEEIKNELAMGQLVRLHVVGHSMGGLVLRAALPIIRNELAGLASGGCHVEFGHYVSLSTPHLGIQSSWRAPLQLWRNLCSFSAFITQQLVQLSVQDRASDKPPFLVALSDPEGPYMEVLSLFQHRTCVTMASGDALIPVASGIIDKELTLMDSGNACCQSSTPSWLFVESDDSRCGDAASSSTNETLKLGKDGGFASMASTEEETVSSGKSRSLAWMMHLQRFLMTGLRSLMRLLMPSGKLSVKELEKQKIPPRVSCKAHACSVTNRGFTWEVSSDGACRFPLEILNGLETLPWRRKIARLHHPPFARNMHVFLIGKSSEQWPSEHKLSMQCINQLVDKVLLDSSAQRLSCREQ